MKPPLRISASSYSNTAPLVWSFLYGPDHGSAELILDNAPARSAELLAHDRVDAALVPIIASQSIDGVSLYPGVCVGAERRVRSVILVTSGTDLDNVDSVALDVSSRTSVILTKVIFREFLGREPIWIDSPPNVDAMLSTAGAALIIGDPALRLSTEVDNGNDTQHRVFDLAELWNRYTGLGFIFAMWMTRRDRFGIDLATARDRGVERISEISANYAAELGLTAASMAEYLSENISYGVSDLMQAGMSLFLELSAKHKMTDGRALRYIGD